MGRQLIAKRLMPPRDPKVGDEWVDPILRTRYVYTGQCCELPRWKLWLVRLFFGDNS